MRNKYLLIILTCVIGVAAVFAGCSDTGSSDNKKLLPFISQPSQNYFPEIPQGVAE